MRLTFQLLLMLTLATAARAGVLVTFDQPNQFANPGDLLHFNGIIFNNGSSDVALDSDVIDPGSPDLTVIDLFGNTPPTLSGNTDSGDIELFDIQVGAAPYGLYTGSYKIYDLNSILLVDAPFSVQVIPEPGTFTLLALAAAALVARTFRLART